MLQILDDGRITDSQGRTVDFKNTVIVMTSNIGAKALTAAGAKLGFDAEDKKARGRTPSAAYAQAKETVLAELRQTFRPEFLNRIDDIIVFRALTEQDIRGGRPPDAQDRGGPDGDHGHPSGRQRRGGGGAGQGGLRSQVRCPSPAPVPSRARWRTPWPSRCWTAPSRPAIPPSWLWRTTSWSGHQVTAAFQ